MQIDMVDTLQACNDLCESKTFIGLYNANIWIPSIILVATHTQVHNPCMQVLSYQQGLVHNQDMFQFYSKGNKILMSMIPIIEKMIQRKGHHLSLHVILLFKINEKY